MRGDLYNLQKVVGKWSIRSPAVPPPGAAITSRKDQSDNPSDMIYDRMCVSRGRQKERKNKTTDVDSIV